MAKNQTAPIKGEWITIEVGGHKFTVWCLPPSEPVDEKLNNLQVFIGVTESLRKVVLQGKQELYSQKALEDWLDKFPKPLK